MTIHPAFGILLGLGLCVGAHADDEPPDRIELTGVVRDFKERSVQGGHPDFERRPDGGFAHYMGNIAPQLGADGKPVFVGGGHKVSRQWKTRNGEPIHPSLYDSSAGDMAGQLDSRVDTGSITSAESFGQWYRDVPGVNMSAPLTLTLSRSGGTDEMPIYTYSSNSFFPIDGKLFGNSGGSPDHNFHFTFELHTQFTYQEGAGQTFSFYGDDDVWVFINGQLVIDIGGVHKQVWQTVNLDRLGLVDGETYPLDFFFAERHRTESNFRIDTTLRLENKELPSVTAAYD